MNEIVSLGLFKKATSLIPDGVNSPVRAFGAVGGTLQFIESAHDAYLWDREKRRYIDYVSSWGPMILWHGDPKVLLALHAQLNKGISFGVTPAQVADTVVANFNDIEGTRQLIPLKIDPFAAKAYDKNSIPLQLMTAMYSGHIMNYSVIP